MSNEEKITRAKSSTRVPFTEDIAPKQLYDDVARGIASNVKMGPFTATSGVVLPCML
jgi:ribosome maturation protein Sdo1